MKKELLLELRLSGTEIQVKAVLPVSAGSLSFSLGAGLSIDELLWAGKPASYRLGNPEEHQFVGRIRRVYAEGPVESGCRVELSYHGAVSGFLNCVEQDKVALSFYSAWYPVECSEDYKASRISCCGMEDFTVLRGRFSNGVWEYRGGESRELCNIIAYRKGTYQKLTLSGLACYLPKDVPSKLAEECLNHGAAALEYYTSLFGKPKGLEDEFIFAVLGLPERGAYCRPGIVVCQGFSEDAQRLYSIPGHELGHLWFCGSDTETWEDWLNETGAEWSNLLFLLHEGREDLFHERLNGLLEIAETVPPIRSSDGSRPAGVHQKGCWLFAQIASEFGSKTVIRILQILNQLTEKKTDALISAVRQELGDEQANYLEKGILV